MDEALPANMASGVTEPEPLVPSAALLVADQGFEREASPHGGMVRWAELGPPALEVRGGQDSQAADASFGMDI